MTHASLDHLASIDDYFDELGRWLELESEAERERLARRRQIRAQADVERTGETLVRMRLVDHQTGLAGRLLLDFTKPGGRSVADESSESRFAGGHFRP